MIEQALYFALGFLSAGLIALIIAPSLWSRAVRLTRRRIEASQPLTLAEIKADRDGLRADFAVTSRRLEMAIADLRHKNADYRIEADRANQRFQGGIAERDRLTAELIESRHQLATREDQIRHLERTLQDARNDTAHRNDLISGLEMRIGDLNADIDNRKVEIASLKAQLEAAGSRQDALAEARRQADARNAALEAELQRRASVITEERQRADRLMTDLVQIRSTLRAEGVTAMPFTPARRDDNERPEIERLTSQNAALEAQIRALSGERDALNHALTQVKVSELSRPADAADISLLRERLGDIAARVASFTAGREGAASTVDQLIDRPAGAESVANPLPVTSLAGEDDDDRTLILPRGDRKPSSLAERIRALRTAAGAPPDAP